MALGVGVAALGKVAMAGWRQGVRGPRLWIRQNPRLGAVALASFFTLASIPGDAFWHELFGIDLTAWIPPHVLLGLTASTVVGGSVSFFTLLLANPEGPRRSYRSGSYWARS